MEKLLGLVSHKTKWLLPQLIWRPVLLLQMKCKSIIFYAWFCHNFYFGYIERKYSPYCCPGRDGLKIQWNGFLKKHSHHCLIKNIHNWDNNIYEANKKPGSRFETCCLLIFLNECLSIYKLQLISNNYYAVWVTFFHMTFGCIPCLMRTSPESCMW